MNERIDELMIQAGARFEFLHGVHYDDFQYRKFAELLIRECYEWAKENGGLGAEYDYDALKEHFGVEE